MSASFTARHFEKLEESVDELILKQEGSHPLDFFRQYRGDFARFAADVLGLKVTPQQQELGALLLSNRRLAVVSGNNLGKTALAAGLVLYWLYCEGPSMALTTAATDTQVRLQLWGEVAKWWHAARERGFVLPGELWTKSLVVDGRANHKAFGLVARPGTHTGYHHANLLLIVDEAHSIETASAAHPEVYDQVWRDLFRLAPRRMLAIGNPSRMLGGKWHAISHDPGWAHLTLSAEAHPNVTSGEEQIPGAITRETLDDWAGDCGGRDTDEWRMMALGEWPRQGALRRPFTLELLERSAKRHDALIPRCHLDSENLLVVGIDPAGEGPNATAIVIVEADYVHPIVRLHGLPPRETARRITNMLDGFGVKRRVPTHDGAGRYEGHRWGTVVVDVAGMGRAVSDPLVEDFGYSVQPFIGGESPDEEIGSRRQALARYGLPGNSRAQGYLRLLWLLERDKLMIPRDSSLWEELLATGTSEQPNGSTLIEKKDIISRRLGRGRSPDAADALSECAWYLGKRRFTGQAGFVNW